jgi:cytochrome c biogenesis protein CcmG/thiol:disulfide interchange protein DsbE
MRMRAFLVSIVCAQLLPAFAAAPLDPLGIPGRVLYLDFWASWCGPCRQSFPWMESMKETYEAQGFDVLAVNLDANRADADKFLREFRPSFPVRYDPAGDLAVSFKVKSMPSSVFIDRHGVVRYSHVGFRPIDERAYEAQLRELLAEK